jgi:transaldolase/glucose-6-phosphate isomerase
VSRQAITLGPLKSPVTSAFRALNSRQFGRRLFAPDPFLWTDDAQQADAIRQELGWLHSIEAFRGKATAITEFATDIKEARFSHVVLFAKGGLNLFPEVCRDTFGVAPGWPQLLVLDNADPATMREVEACIDPARTLFIIASKSGTTAETLTLFRYVYDRLKPQPWYKDFAQVTDAEVRDLLERAWRNRLEC